MVLILSLEDIPSQLADYLGTNLGTAQVLLSIVVIFAVVLPVMLLAKDKHQMPILITVFLTEMLLVGLGWLPFWVLITTIAIVATGIALLGSKMVTGE